VLGDDPLEIGPGPGLTTDLLRVRLPQLTSIGRPDLAAFHDDDTYNPVDPATLEARLTAAGFVDIDVKANERAWACQARRP
jgi:hypothetical protein